MRFVAALIGLAASFSGCGRVDAIHGSAQDVMLDAGDGVRIAATHYPSTESKAPGVILVHMLGSDRSRWAGLAPQLQRAGYACMAIDMRGHGDSAQQQGKTLSFRAFTTEEWMGVLRDIDAAKRGLIDRGANAANIALAGASIGANLALRYAAVHGDAPAVILISPGLDYHGVAIEQAMIAYGKRPSLLMASDGDGYSASSCARLKEVAPGHCEWRQYPGGAHGTDLLDASDSARSQLVTWLDAVMRGKGVAADAS
ncbi:MAG TPA: alpha/beta fold hydrolase [Candidatus Hydrogenedentes bacterium]|nr:alpha/beta fold hydrolase [Candidatus Hydrogenedentota bacterium]HOS02519.1 alpha/beta fold hydrolase [Candidatus Hydrogenedentota bacterium]